jgi:hypothetical protein
MVKPVSDGSKYTRSYQQTLNDFGITQLLSGIRSYSEADFDAARAHESAIKKLQSSVCLRERSPQLHSTFLLLFIRWRGLFLHFLLVFSGCLLQNEC